jgi:hypothetical protein
METNGNASRCVPTVFDIVRYQVRHDALGVDSMLPTLAKRQPCVRTKERLLCNNPMFTDSSNR